MSPTGKPLKQTDLIEFSKIDQIVILCGRFEGVDNRAIVELDFQEVSIGDYIITGGEVAAQVLVEGCIRLLPGVLGHPESVLEESFSNDLLEYPQYTRPKVWTDTQNIEHHVPDILLSGHHEKIKEWRNNKSFEKTIDSNFRTKLYQKIILNCIEEITRMNSITVGVSYCYAIGAYGVTV